MSNIAAQKRYNRPDCLAAFRYPCADVDDSLFQNRNVSGCHIALAAWLTSIYMIIRFKKVEQCLSLLFVIKKRFGHFTSPRAYGRCRFRIIDEELRCLAYFRTGTGLDKHRIVSMHKEPVDVGNPGSNDRLAGCKKFTQFERKTGVCKSKVHPGHARDISIIQ